MISRILVPTDGSKPARKSVEYAAELAKQTGATLTLISVIDKIHVIPRAIPVEKTKRFLMEPVEDFLRKSCEAYLEDAERLCSNSGVKPRKVIRTGHPAEEIIKEAQKSKVDLIVIGSQGRNALKAAVMGSVTFGIISKESRIPVLVVRK
jgi:nucleotide-binding universal stress UspA family protein